MPSKDAANVNQLVRLLDRTERLLVTFYYVERLTPAEIALVLDIAPPRVIELLGQVRQRIQEAVTGEAPQIADADATDRSRSALSLGNTSSPV